MTTKMTFGECLKYLLTTLHISRSRLSKAINVDSSLISRWIHGKRIPSFDTSYIENIADYLSKNIFTSLQMKLLNEFFWEFKIDTRLSSNYKENIKRVLLETQGFSLECKKMEQENKKYMSSSNLGLTNTTNLTNADRILYETDTILTTCISMLESALAYQNKENNIIYITFNNEVPETFHDQFLRIRNLILQVIENGWHIVFMIRITHSIHRLMKFINYILPIIQTGKVNIYYLTNYDVFTAERELCVIPGVGVLSCFSMVELSQLNCAFYLQSKAAIDIFLNYTKTLHKYYTHKLFKYYSKEMNGIYYEKLTETMERKGEQLNYNCNFSMTLLPEHLYAKLMRRENISHQDISLSLSYHKRQVTGITTNLSNYKYKDIYFSQTMDDLISHRTLTLHTYSSIQTVTLETQDIIDYLNNIIHFILTYDNYEIAVIHNDSANLVKNTSYNYIIKERQAVFSEVYDPSQNKPDVRLSTKEPMIVKAFVENYHKLWSSIAPINKDKIETITWLQSYIKTVS